MAVKTNNTVNGYNYFRFTKVVGKRINEHGHEIPIRKEFRGKTKKEAEEKYQAYMEKKRQGLETSKQYFGIVAENWIYDFFVNDNKLAKRTRDLYIQTWNRYIKPTSLYSMPLEEVTAATLQNIYNSLDCPTSALKTADKLMKRLYKYMEQQGLSRNFTGSLVIPAKEKEHNARKNEITVWSDEEITKILNSFEEAQGGFRLSFLITLAYYTGCRISELLAVKYSDFTDNGLDINKQIINEPTHSRNEKTVYNLKESKLKTASSYRVIPLNDEVMKGLARHKKWQKKEMVEKGYRTDYLFTTDTGKFYDKKNIITACNRYYKRIGVTPKGFHTYRHTFGTNLCRSGVPLQTASALLGHADINVTAKYYINVSTDEKLKAVSKLVEIVNK